jgi:prepilin-type N-terminal cleavage/methylation domain-containing protein
MKNNFEEGFTLIELLIVIAIIGVIITASAGVYITSYKVWNRISKVVDLQGEARALMTILSKDLRRARVIDTGGNSATDIIKIKIDSDGDGVADKYVIYSVNQNIFLRKQKKLDNDGNPAEEFSQIKNLTSEIVINPDTYDIFTYNEDQKIVQIKLNLSNETDESNQIDYKIRDKIQLRSIN